MNNQTNGRIAPVNLFVTMVDTGAGTSRAKARLSRHRALVPVPEGVPSRQFVRALERRVKKAKRKTATKELQAERQKNWTGCPLPVRPTTHNARTWY